MHRKRGARTIGRDVPWLTPVCIDGSLKSPLEIGAAFLQLEITARNRSIADRARFRNQDAQRIAVNLRVLSDIQRPRTLILG